MPTSLMSEPGTSRWVAETRALKSSLPPALSVTALLLKYFFDLVLVFNCCRFIPKLHIKNNRKAFIQSLTLRHLPE